MKSPPDSFSTEAVFIGKKPLTGQVTSTHIEEIAASLVGVLKPEEQQRCVVECSSEGLKIFGFRNDEGFESDSGSTGSDSKTKLVKSDSDDTSSANSSGSDSDDVAVKATAFNNYVKDVYNLEDVVFVHTLDSEVDVISWVVREASGLCVVLFKCKTEDRCKELYRICNENSRGVKLQRYIEGRRSAREHRSKIDIGEFSSLVNISDSDPKAIGVTVNNIILPQSETPDWNLLQRTDRNGITHIEIESHHTTTVTSIDNNSDEPSSIISISTPEFTYDRELGSFSGSREDNSRGSRGRSRQRQPPLLLRGRKEQEMIRRPDELRRSEEQLMRFQHSKGPAPQPPPRRHPTNPNLKLVPTKSGAEDHPTLYPKEVHVVRGSFVRMSVNEFDPSMMRRATKAEINNNGIPRCLPDWQHMYRTRDVEVRRRSRSKSPARRQSAHKYIDAGISNITGLSQKFREFSGAMMQRRFKLDSKQQQELAAVEVTPPKTPKSLIKSEKRYSKPSPETKRVTFNAYATVQVMDT